MKTPLIDNVANNNRQTKSEYRFTVDKSLEAYPIDWYNAYFEVYFKLVTLADTGVGIAVGANGANRWSYIYQRMKS